jgi:hypothetical protein
MDQFSNRTHGRCSPLCGGSSLSRPYSLSPDGFTSFHLPSGVLFNFHSRYYCAIGLGESLGFGVHAPGIPTEFQIRSTLCSGITLVLLLRGFHPLRRPVPRDFEFQRSGGPGPHISMRSSRTDSACPLPFSIAFTHGITIVFFSSAY